MEFDIWYAALQELARKHGKNIGDLDAWREEFDTGKSFEVAFYSEYPTCNPAAKACDELPSKAKRVLIGELKQRAGTKLPTGWYDFPRNSNFDKFPREKIKEAAEAAGFIEYKGGHAWVSELGHAWARAQSAA